MKMRFLVQIKGTVYHWNHAGNSFQVGRSLDCELPLTGPECAVVSGRHARFECNDNGLIVWDLASKNGTYLNSRRIHTPQRLAVGDVVSLGESGPRLTVMDYDAPGVAHSKTMPPAPLSSPSLSGSIPPQQSAPVAEPEPRTATEQVGANSPFARSMAPFSPDQPSATRLMLLSTMRNQKRLWWIVGVLFLLLAGSVAVIWLMASRDNVGADSEQLKNSDVYHKILRSTAWVVMPTKHGTGVVVDQKNRLIVTNYHIVGDNQYAYCSFPAFENGMVINTIDFYRSGRKINGKVVTRDSKRDLAVIQLEEPLPDHIVALPLADESAETGDEIFLVGANPEGSGKGMWIFRDGKVSQVGENEAQSPDGRTISAKMVLSNIPVNRGDSGSGIVNRRGKLVGVTWGSDAAAKSMTYHIDITEVRTILRRVSVRGRFREKK